MEIVQADDFLQGNYLVKRGRISVTLLQTNAAVRSPAMQWRQYLGQLLSDPTRPFRRPDDHG